MRLRRPATPTRDGARPPEERSLSDARFIGSFPQADISLEPPLPEVALLGRSNVGKSSLLNAVAGRRIAKTSRTPGKTRMLNVYLVSGAWCTTHHAFYFLDLPGYGYARASQADRAAFGRLIAHTLARPRCCGVLWLLDLRRDPSADDRAMQDLFAARETPVLAVLTKSDALSRREGAQRERGLQAALALDDDQLIATSVREGTGIGELREAIGRLVG